MESDTKTTQARIERLKDAKRQLSVIHDSATDADGNVYNGVGLTQEQADDLAESKTNIEEIITSTETVYGDVRQ